MKIIHIISGLFTGGAELMLYNLLSYIDKSQLESIVISLSENGPVGGKIQNLGVPVIALDMRLGINTLHNFSRLISMLRQERPTLVHTWMYHADFLGGIAAKFFSRTPVVWSIHHADPRLNKVSTKVVAKLCSFLSYYLPDKIIACSESAKSSHISYGYNPKKTILMQNGVDISRFRPDNLSRALIRKRLNIGENDIVIGNVGRWHEIKDYSTLIAAACLLCNDRKNVHFVLAGNGLDNNNKILTSWICKAQIEGRVHLLGERDNIPNIINSFDIFTLTSLGESFSLVTVEAMACGVPCVVTDVGMLADIIVDTGKVVPPQNPDALAHAWSELIRIGMEERMQMGSAARGRVEKHFSFSATVAQYEALYREVCR